MAGIFGSVAADVANVATEDQAVNVWHAASEGELAKMMQGLAAMGNTVDAADENGYTLLMAGSSYGHVQICQWLLDNGAQVNLQDVEGDTALHYCTTSPECMQLLVARGGNLGIANSEGKPVLQKLEEEFEEEKAAFAEDMLSGSTQELQNMERVLTFLKSGVVPPPSEFTFTISEASPEATADENPAIDEEDPSSAMEQ